jgi:hypothetical protein
MVATNKLIEANTDIPKAFKEELKLLGVFVCLLGVVSTCTNIA